MGGFYAHKSDDGRLQTLNEHLECTAERSEAFAELFGCAAMGRLNGGAHDVGKGSDPFQNRLLRDGKKVDHATAGALEIMNLYEKVYGKDQGRVLGLIGAYCVMGHHGGLPDGGSSSDEPGNALTGGTLYARLKKQVARSGARVDAGHIPDYTAFMGGIALPSPQPPPLNPIGRYGFSMSMLIRMLFSCLVDADFLDTERFMNEGRVERGGFGSIPVLLERLQEYLKKFDNPTTDINRKRNEILEDCLAMGAKERGLYSLTVPTGGGKTIASLAFALTHARRHGMNRVIYVIPYTNIIEQTADTFAKILGRENVLEHHSGFDYNNEDDGESRLHLASENWDAPVIVTTNVQFFESLFASRTSKCRKLHNIAGSVIIFDEAQMLPTQYLLACTRAIAELTLNYGCTAVLCTATQPALDPFLPKEVARREICRDPCCLYTFFKRVQVKHIGELSDEALAERLSEHEQVLCILNTRKQAQNVYKLLGEGEGNVHLSTLMYPSHRKAILEVVRKRLKDGLPCRVVATSLVEAGVDVDFPFVYRARAGLDSVVQAAGRCNREGKRDARESFTYVFDPDASYRMPASWRQPAEVMAMIGDKYPEDIACLDAIHDYFRLLYTLKGEALDADGVLEQLESGFHNGMSFPFRTIGERFRLIDDATHTILIPIDDEAKRCADRLREGERSRALMRGMGAYCVNVYADHYYALLNMGYIEQPDMGYIEKNGVKPEMGVSILCDMTGYSCDTGLTLEPEGGKAQFA